MLERIDRQSERLSRERGTPVTRAEMVKILLGHSLQVLEAEAPGGDPGERLIRARDALESLRDIVERAGELITARKLEETAKLAGKKKRTK